MPELLPIVAIAVLLVLHVPPGEVLKYVVLDPVHKNAVPEMLVGAVCTVTLSTASAHPFPRPYTTFVVPLLTGVSSPVLLFMVATAVLLLLHVPPVMPFV
jgi:hypothetical protein